MFVFNIFREPLDVESLCATCAYSHIEKGFLGQVQTFCNFASPMRRIEFDLCDCTDYIDRRAAKPMKVAGFVKPINDASA